MPVLKGIVIESTISALLLPVPVLGLDGASPEEVLGQRQDIIEGILTDERREDVAKTRWSCMIGQEAASVRDARARGIDFTPDVSDGCVAMLQRDGCDALRAAPDSGVLRTDSQALSAQCGDFRAQGGAHFDSGD
jgi:hypothetical protein